MTVTLLAGLDLVTPNKNAITFPTLELTLLAAVLQTRMSIGDETFAVPQAVAKPRNSGGLISQYGGGRLRHLQQTKGAPDSLPRWYNTSEMDTLSRCPVCPDKS